MTNSTDGKIIRLSQHLNLDEFTYSITAIRNKIDNTLPQSLMPNARLCAEMIFEPVRALLGGIPRTINSGYRCQRLNQLVDGSPTSQHMAASAIDIGMRDGENIYLAFLKLLKAKDFVFDQLLIEGVSASNPLSGWLHASWNSLNVRGKLDSGFHPNAVQRKDVMIVTFDTEGRKSTRSVTIAEAIQWAENRLEKLNAKRKA